MWGQHLIVDARAGDLARVQNAETIIDFVGNLVENIGMVAFGKPILKHFGTHDLAGYSLVQLIETSAVTGHFVDSTGDFYLDVFSCKPFDAEEAIKIINDSFRPQALSKMVITRQA